MLGIITSVGGYLDVGSVATALQAGAAFGFQLLWVIALGTICVIFLMEMAGRLAAVSGEPFRAVMRERLGFDFFFVTGTITGIVNLMTLAAEIGGTCIALQLLTGVSFQWWAPVVALLTWLVIWFGPFALVEDGGGVFGLLTLLFVVAAVKVHPDWSAVAGGFVPSLPSHDAPRYWFIAVALMGATIMPSMFSFYAAGAVEEEWGVKDIGVNRVTATIGMSFGSVISMGVLVVAAVVLGPLGIAVDKYDQAALVLTRAFGSKGFVL